MKRWLYVYLIPVCLTLALMAILRVRHKRARTSVLRKVKTNARLHTTNPTSNCTITAVFSQARHQRQEGLSMCIDIYAYLVLMLSYSQDHYRAIYEQMRQINALLSRSTPPPNFQEAKNQLNRAENQIKYWTQQREYKHGQVWMSDCFLRFIKYLTSQS